MTIEHITVGVVAARKAVDHPWIDHVWTAVAVLPDAPDVAPWTVLSHTPDETRYYLGPHTFALYKSDTAHLLENFASPQAKLWVSIRPTGLDPPLELVGVTADSSEGEGYVDNLGDVVEALPMPALVAERVIAFCNAHHVEQVFVKRQRDKARTDVFQRGGPGPGPGKGPGSASGGRHGRG
jgi:hypothetical protein